MPGPLNDLAQLTDALYQAELLRMRGLNAREASLRHDLAQLEARRRNNLSLPEVQLNPVRQIGADVLWEGWVSRTRADLNTQLAQVLAKKAYMMIELRRAFGKHAAATELLKNAQGIKSKRCEKQRWQAQEALQLLKSHQD